MSSYYNREKMNNGIYRIASTLPQISIKEDFTANLLSDDAVVKHQINFNEKMFYQKYEKKVTSLLDMCPKLFSEIEDLRVKFNSMHDHLTKLGEMFVIDDDLYVQGEVFDNVNETIHRNTVKNIQMYKKLHTTIK